jgi:hypothetical protein
VESDRSLERQNSHFRRKKRQKPSQAAERNHIAVLGGVLTPLDFRLNFSPALPLIGATKNAAKLSPELGNAVSSVVEKLSRKIHIETTKSYACGVVSVYL